VNNISRICLGTAALGLAGYPPGRHTPRPTYAESGAIIRAALAAGITHFDSGAAYGDADIILRKWTSGGHRTGSNGVTVTSKVAPELVDIYTDEFAPFGGPVLLHNPTVAQLENPSMTSLAEGASVYTVAEAEAAIRAGLKHLQVPYHVLDQRHAMTFEAAWNSGVTVYARQPWARGLLVLESYNLRETLCEQGWPVSPEPFERFHRICIKRKVGYVEAGLRFSLASPADFVVFGVSSLAQLEQTVAIASTDPPASWAGCYAELLSTFADSALTLGSVCTPGR
jgi:aryl-alcohol dehydrogenase-like predicted oxidoreductase